jgi:hypothetical protein
VNKTYAALVCSMLIGSEYKPTLILILLLKELAATLFFLTNFISGKMSEVITKCMHIFDNNKENESQGPLKLSKFIQSFST